MNYQHAYHAGNFADVLKHIVLTRILLYLTRKSSPFRVIDTHAGEGGYRLDRNEAERSGEWRQGVGRILACEPARAFGPEAERLLTPYLEAVRAEGALAYPGSPALTQRFLRESDRGIFCEKHPSAFAALKSRFRKDKRIKALQMDGWSAFKAFTPPPEKRGLILIDPPFEEPGEFSRMASHFQDAYRKWPTGVYMFWHPIKEPTDVADFIKALKDAGVEKLLRLELTIGAYIGAGLTRTGLAIVNPPYVLLEEARVFLPPLAKILEKSQGSGSWTAH